MLAWRNRLVVSPTTLDITEGESGTFTVRLDAAPTGNVTVELLESRTEISLTGGTPDPNNQVGRSTLTFTTGNWNTPRTITVNTSSHDNDLRQQHS